MRFKHLILTIVALGVLLGLTASCHADGLANTTSLAAGINGVWWDGADAPGPDLEAAANGAMSLSPHLSLVGSVDYGLTHTYARSTIGVRVTATDVDNPNFSVGLGFQYHAASITALRPNEWAPDVSVGLRPWPVKWPAWSLAGLGWYGLDSNRAAVSAGVRYRFNL